MSIYILYALYTFTYGTMIAEFLGISFFFWCFCFDMLLQANHPRKESNSCAINCFLLAGLFYKSFSEISLIRPSENISSMSQIFSAAFLWVTIRTVFSVISRRLDNTFFFHLFIQCTFFSGLSIALCWGGGNIVTLLSINYEILNRSNRSCHCFIKKHNVLCSRTNGTFILNSHVSLIQKILGHALKRCIHQTLIICIS